MGNREYELGTAELEVLKVLWDAAQPLTVRQVLNDLHRRGRSPAYTTVQTFLTRLKQKGYVASRQTDESGLAHVFRATVSRAAVTRSRLDSLLAQLFDGAAGPLALHLIKNERFTPTEIEELQKLIDRLDDRDSKGKRANR